METWLDTDFDSKFNFDSKYTVAALANGEKGRLGKEYILHRNLVFISVAKS